MQEKQISTTETIKILLHVLYAVFKNKLKPRTAESTLLNKDMWRLILWHYVEDERQRGGRKMHLLSLYKLKTLRDCIMTSPNIQLTIETSRK